MDGLSIHPKKWTVCHTVIFRPTVILANQWLWHFFHFGFWFFYWYLVQVAADFDKWQSRDTVPLTFWPSHTDSGGQDPTKRTEGGCFFDYFSDPTTHLEATATCFPRGDFDPCDILSTSREKSRKASRWSPVTCDKTFTFRFGAKVDILSQSR